jgi:exodeoxyribonuclease VII large subunit
MLTVSEFTSAFRYLVDTTPELQDVWIEGEISNLKKADSGHWYFTLKDDQAQLKAVMWRSSTARIIFKPRDGDKIAVHGKLTLYEPRGEYQLVADFLRRAGVGDLYAQFEALKARLNEEGLFDLDHKQPIPEFPRRIGVVTSADAAAFQDVQNVLRRRYPLADVILSHTLVQGEDAPPQIIAALERLDRTAQVDVILLVRGGGSLEDLWAFNDEQLARAVYAANTPIISGVGHETDFTIVDFVADLRAPTPSAAAELTTPSLDALKQGMAQRRARLQNAVRDELNGQRATLKIARRQLAYLTPRQRIETYRRSLDERQARLTAATQRQITLKRERLAAKSDAVHAASPQAILKRGYAIVTDSNGQTISSAADAPATSTLHIQFADGTRTVTVNP